MKKVTVKPTKCDTQKKAFLGSTSLSTYLYRKLLGFFTFFIGQTVHMSTAIVHDLTGTIGY